LLYVNLFTDQEQSIIILVDVGRSLGDLLLLPLTTTGLGLSVLCLAYLAEGCLASVIKFTLEFIEEEIVPALNYFKLRFRFTPSCDVFFGSTDFISQCFEVFLGKS